MAPPFEEIEPKLSQLRAFVLDDLERIVNLDVGGNYAAIAVLVSAYEALGYLREEQGHVVFGEQLPARWQAVAKSLYAALRNGLAHHYDPKLIVLDGGGCVELFISWRKRPHLSVADGRLYVNVQQMATGLRAAFDDYEQSLHDRAELRVLFSARATPEHFVGGGEVHVWRELLNL